MTGRLASFAHGALALAAMLAATAAGYALRDWDLAVTKIPCETAAFNPDLTDDHRAACRHGEAAPTKTVYTDPALANNRRTGLDARITTARSRQESVLAAFYVCAQHGTPMGGPCGRASALPVPLFRSSNPHVSAHPFLDEGAADSDHNNGVMP